MFLDAWKRDDPADPARVCDPFARGERPTLALIKDE